MLLVKYAELLKPGGIIIIELTDAVADYRIGSDNYLGEALKNVFPVRQTPAQVGKCAAIAGLAVAEKVMSTYGLQPRTSYVLVKSISN